MKGVLSFFLPLLQCSSPDLTVAPTSQMNSAGCCSELQGLLLLLCFSVRLCAAVISLSPRLILHATNARAGCVRALKWSGRRWLSKTILSQSYRASCRSSTVQDYVGLYIKPGGVERLPMRAADRNEAGNDLAVACYGLECGNEFPPVYSLKNSSSIWYHLGNIVQAALLMHFLLIDTTNTLREEGFVFMLAIFRTRHGLSIYSALALSALHIWQV